MQTPFLISSRTCTETPGLNMFPMHSHDHYELFCFLKGSAQYYIEGNIYYLHPGDILLMKCAEAHSLIIDKVVPYERIVISFNKAALIGEMTSEIIEFLDNRPLGTQNRYSTSHAKELLSYLNKVCESNDFKEQQLYLTFVLHELGKSTPKQAENKTSIQDIVSYINSHLFDADITLNLIAERFFMTPNHLNRKFKQYVGDTVWSYITAKRLATAKNMLLSGEKPLVVYEKCGFADYSTFYRAYKQKYGIAPNQEK